MENAVIPIVLLGLSDRNAWARLGLYNKLPYRKLPDKLLGKLPSNLFINYPVIYSFWFFFEN